MSDNLKKYNELRKKFPEFIYKEIQVEDTGDILHLKFCFSVPGLSEFTPEWFIPKKDKTKDLALEIKSNLTLSRLIFSLGMIELVSYYKIACPKSIVIDVKGAASLIDEAALSWWKEQYYYGLGEFFYTNEIPLDKEGFCSISFGPYAVEECGQTGENKAVPVDIFDFNKISRDTKTFLIPVGGGKDSAVSLELLSDFKEESYCYMINGRGATFATAKAAEYLDEKVIVAKRTLDKRMLELNKQGFLNGHTPFSAMAAFSCILTGYLYGLPYAALSNESSANESTVAGSTVNHQYSKSFKFEEDFTAYERKYIGSGVLYFSLLRPWSEYQIAREFAKHPKYHKIFRSCNVGSKEDKWCGHCAKCLFVFVIMSPFISIEKLTEIFGRNMLEDMELWDLLSELCGMVDQKPFECVGSRDEVNTAIRQTIAKFTKEGKEIPALFRKYMETPFYIPYREEDNIYLNFFEKTNNVPDFLIDRLKPERN